MGIPREGEPGRSVAENSLYGLGRRPCRDHAGSGRVAQDVESAPKAATTCDVVREALLNGTPAEVEAWMKAPVADKSPDATAREYADYWLNRDADSPDMRETDESLIRMSCSI
jgi:hypothetical protein